MKELRVALEQRRAARLYRSRRIAEGAQGPERVVDGRRVVSFCSNDYLGLAKHPAVIEAFKRAADEYGVGSGAAHLVSGHTLAHHALEEELAEFTGCERALLFSTGYMANLGVVSALVGRRDVVLEDRLNHASLLDAGLLSGARMLRYAHADAAALLRQIERVRTTSESRSIRSAAGVASSEGNFHGQRKPGAATSGRSPATPRTILIATDGVFSMDGDIAPVRELAQIAVKHDGWLMVDDAHGLGVLGDSGGGTLEHLGAGHCSVPILMGTLGKALGTFGAFVAGRQDLIEMLIQVARTYIYTTAPPPAVAEATRAALRVCREENWRRQKLREIIKRFRSGAQQLGLPLMASVTPIQPLLIGDAAKAKAASDALFEQGVHVTAIRPPTVPRDTARLRITLSAAHAESHVDRLLQGLESVLA